MPPTIMAISPGDARPLSLFDARLNAISTSMLPMTMVTSESASIDSALSASSFGNTRIPSQPAKMDSGTLNQNSQRQLSTISISPASTGPIAGPSDRLMLWIVRKSG